MERVPEKNKKIKKGKKPKHLTKQNKSDSEAVEEDKPRSSHKQHKFYTIKEDSVILESFLLKNPNTTKIELFSQIAKQLNRTVESVRERYRRYILGLDKADVLKIQELAKTNPDSYLYFKEENGKKIIDKSSDKEPHLSNRDTNKKNKLGKPVVRQERANNSDFSWIIKKLSCNDPYYALDHSVHLLNSIFASFVQEGTAVEDINKFIKESNGEVSLHDVFVTLTKSN